MEIIRLSQPATLAELLFQRGIRWLFKSFPSTTMLPQRQNSPFRDRDVCYSNLFKTPLCCQKGRYPLSGIDIFVSRIFSRRQYALTQAEFPFQGVRRLLYKSFRGTTMPPQRQSSPFQGYRRLLFEYIPAATMLPQR